MSFLSAVKDAVSDAIGGLTSKLKNYAKKNLGTAPMAKIKIGSSVFKRSKNVKITNISVSSSVGNEAGTCHVEFVFPHLSFEKFKLPSDFAKVKVGEKLEVFLGYRNEDNTEVVFKGYISSFDLEVDDNAVATLTIEGMDAKMWMMTSKKTELKKEKHRYSDIVNALCSSYSGKVKIGKVKISGESKFKADLYQYHESDYEFLCRIADLVGAMFFVSLGKLYFVDATSFEKSELKIMPTPGLYKVKLSASVWGIPKAVEVLSINQKNPTAVVKGKVTSSKQVGSGKGASSLTKNISKANTITIVDNTLTSAKEAKTLAQAIYNERELNLVETNIKMMGYPEAKLGTKVSIDGFSNPINNNYVVTGVTHKCNFNTNTYYTFLTMKTNRVKPQTNSLL